MSARPLIWVFCGILLVPWLADTAQSIEGSHFARSFHGGLGYYSDPVNAGSAYRRPYYAVRSPNDYGYGDRYSYRLGPYFAGIYPSRGYFRWAPRLVLVSTPCAAPEKAAAPSYPVSPPTPLTILNPYAMKTEAEVEAALATLPERPLVIYPSRDAKSSG